MTQSRPRGLRSIRGWQSLLARPTSAIYARLSEIYGAPAPLDEPARVCSQAVEEFGRRFGYDREVILGRTTGRVNLMGMHIDHRGGSVNAIAIKEVFFVAEPREDDLVALANVDSERFPDEHFSIHECLPASKIHDWDTWSHEELEKRRNDSSATWSNYVRAAVLYLQNTYRNDDGAFSPALRGMNAVVNGNIPQAAGLSTSSSLVVAAAEACAYLNGLSIEPMDLVRHCGYAEWYVGTRGGSGDHAAIKFGRPNAIVHVTSFPLTAEPVPFPPGYSVVLANSLVEAKKQAGARDAFNSRVASYVFGLMIARKRFPEYAPKLQHLRDINPKTLGVSEADVYRVIGAMPECASRKALCELLADAETELRQVFRSHQEPPDGYKIRRVCLYGISECIRAEMAMERLKAGDIEGFGELIDISHEGDRVTHLEQARRVRVDHSCPDAAINQLISDADSRDPTRLERSRLWRQPGGYDCSCEEIDCLVDIARSVRGTVGAGLVGAGLGGSMIALVKEDAAQTVIDEMAARYYRPRDLPVAAHVVRPVRGSGIIEID